MVTAHACLLAQPSVTKVEPPNWWAGHSIDPVRLLLRGKDLCNAKVEGPLKAFDYKWNANCTYLFADLAIPRGTKPSNYTFSVVHGQGRGEFSFEVSEPLDRKGRFQGFSPEDVIYLIMPDRFSNGDPSNDGPAQMLDRKKGRYYHGGDFQGIINKLPYLKDLGVTAIWLNPVYDNANRLNERETYGGEAITDYHGYGAVDFYGVEEHFGTMEKLRELVDAAHKAGIKIIHDQVANHSGPYHPWVKDPPTPTWYNGTEASHINETWQTWTLADPHSSAALRKSTLEGWFANILPDLNQNDPETARYIIQNALWWVGMTGLDGIRQDTWPYVPRDFWRDWMSAIKREYPSLRAVGEVFDGDPAMVSFFQGGDAPVDSLFDFPVYYKMRSAFAQGKSVRDLPKMLANDRLYSHPERLVTFLGLHDVMRFMNEKGATAEGLKLAFTALLTMRGTPMIYYGDEIGMPGGDDPDNRRDFPGGWPGEEFQRSPDQEAIFSHVRKLLSLRKSTPALRTGATENLVVEEQQWAYARSMGSSKAVVVINNAAAPAKLTMAAQGKKATPQLGLASLSTSGMEWTVELPARSGDVLLVY